jgi:DNA-binding transcriptional LysR family regulator
MVHNSPVFDWDDLKYLLAVARYRSTLAASRALQVDQSTVQRRLVELERRIGWPLVQRHPTGYRLTEFGQKMLPHAERVEQAVLAFERHLQAPQRDASGVIRVTCPEAMVSRITSLLLDRFHARYPALRVQLITSDKNLDLRKGEADVALRPGDTAEDELIGRKIGESTWSVYASRAYIEQQGQPARVEDLEQHGLIGFDETMSKHRVSEWLRTVAPNGKFVARSNSVLGLMYSVKAGVGVAPLPAPVGDAEPDLVRVLGPIAELTFIWRLLTTPDLRRTPRVSAFFDFIVEEIEAVGPIFSG